MYGVSRYSSAAAQTLSLVERACAKAGLNAARAHILHHYNNAIVYLPAEHAVARFTTGREALQRVQRTQASVRWLIDTHEFPATAPLLGVQAVEVDNLAVGFWRYYPQPANMPSMDSRDLALLLRRLHLSGEPLNPPPAWEPLTSLFETIHDPSASASLAEDERKWIDGKIAEIRGRLNRLSWPLGFGLIHGDAWVGNLLWDNAGPHAILGDWDRVSIGPREVDLIPTWHAATRYGQGPAWARQFADVYGYDLAAWDGYPLLLAMRDLVQLTGPIRRAGAAPKYEQALRQRLDALRTGNTSSTWIAL